MSKNTDNSSVAHWIDGYRASLQGVQKYHDCVYEISVVASMIKMASNDREFASEVAKREPDLADRMMGHPRGRLALKCHDKALPLEILESASGFFLGTTELYAREGDAALTRESVEYWSHPRQAFEALMGGSWTQRRAI